MRTITLVLTLSLLPLLAGAVPTGLNTIPSADVLGMATSRFEAELGGSGKLYADRNSTVIGAEQGLALGLEAGVDNVSGRGLVYNAKWQFKGDGLILPALAVGVQDVSHGEKPQYYLVATKSAPYKLISGTAGLMRANGDWLTMLGAAVNFGVAFAQGDLVRGGIEDRSSVGIGVRISKFRIKGTSYDFDNAPSKKTVTVSYEFGGF